MPESATTAPANTTQIKAHRLFRAYVAGRILEGDGQTGVRVSVGHTAAEVIRWNHGLGAITDAELDAAYTEALAEKTEEFWLR